MSENRIACSEDLVRTVLDTQLRCKRGGDVDLREDSEALCGKCFDGSPPRRPRRSGLLSR